MEFSEHRRNQGQTWSFGVSKGQFSAASPGWPPAERVNSVWTKSPGQTQPQDFQNPNCCTALPRTSHVKGIGL